MKKLFNSTYKSKVAGAALAVFTAGCFTGCEKKLETEVYSQLTGDNFFKSASDMEAALILLYSPFSSNWGNDDPGVGSWYASLYNADVKTYLIRSMMTTDELSTDWDANLTNFTFGPSTWSGGNEPNYAKIRYVAKATDVIDKISKVEGVSDEIKNKYSAEAKVLRAWTMYVLYDFFGPVNAKYDPATLASTEIKARPTKEEYCGQIEKDLKEAIPFLKDKYNNDSGSWGRVSKGLARMLLLKLYMHNKQWDKAEAVGKEIIAMGYGLEDNYADVFNKKANKELIYAVPTTTASPNYWVQEVLPSDFSKAGVIKRGGGWNGYYMPWAFYDKFSANDKRKSTILAEYDANWGHVDRSATWWRGAIPLKYTAIEGDGPGYALDVVVFRYAEVLLSVAEAINEQRGPAEAYQFVNLVRARAGVLDFSGMNKDQFKDAILDERARELYCEGSRRQDLIRHGKFISNAQSRGKTSAAARHVLFPIPSAVIIEGKGIIGQNDDYQ